MLALEAERHVLFAYIAVVKYSELNQWKMSRKRWKNLHKDADTGRDLWYDSGGMTLFNCCGDADAAAEAPPRLTSSPGLANNK